jgi:cytochrome c peroxidase
LTGQQLANDVQLADDTGAFTTISSHGFIDLGNEFFQDLGTNGRRCVSCHMPTAGWTITPRQLKLVFDATNGGISDDGFGLGAVFRPNDGANSPNADMLTLNARRAAYSMLLERGVIRIGLPILPSFEFEVVTVDDPYGFASASQLSLFRRPLPTTNLKFNSTVMWDAREVVSDLATQANDEVQVHAQGSPLSVEQIASIVDFETSLATAQTQDSTAGDLHDAGGLGGPDEISNQPFYIGINDLFGDSKTGSAFTPAVFTIYNAWSASTGTNAAGRLAVARGQALFNSKPIMIQGVSGINDEAAFGMPAMLMGTCSTCHDTPNGGSHSVVAQVDIGLVDVSRRTADMPLYTLRNKMTGESKQVTDPGRALIDGKWKHIGRFKAPVLRDLAPRPPYFHDGSAADLAAVIDFYDSRFAIGFSPSEKSDLVAFLRSL